MRCIIKRFILLTCHMVFVPWFIWKKKDTRQQKEQQSGLLRGPSTKYLLRPTMINVDEQTGSCAIIVVWIFLSAQTHFLLNNNQWQTIPMTCIWNYHLKQMHLCYVL